MLGCQRFQGGVLRLVDRRGGCCWGLVTTAIQQSLDWLSATEKGLRQDCSPTSFGQLVVCLQRSLTVGVILLLLGRRYSENFDCIGGMFPGGEREQVSLGVHPPAVGGGAAFINPTVLFRLRVLFLALVLDVRVCRIKSPPVAGSAFDLLRLEGDNVRCIRVHTLHTDSFAPYPKLRAEVLVHRAIHDTIIPHPLDGVSNQDRKS